MANPHQVDIERLWALAQNGYSARALMKELDITSLAGLKNAQEELLREKGENDILRGLIGEASLTESRNMDGL